jgi:hypothetical protein
MIFANLTVITFRELRDSAVVTQVGVERSPPPRSGIVQNYFSRHELAQLIDYDRKLRCLPKKSKINKPTRGCIQIENGIVNAMHLIVVDEVPMEYKLRYQMPESLWKRFKNTLDQVEAETARAEALAAPGSSSKG